LLRNTLVFATGLGFLIHWLWPLMPPRMFGSLGFADSAGAAIYAEDKLGPFANQFAAMPSLHFGWALLVGIVPLALSRRRIRWVMLAHPVLTLAAIVITANHYFLDAVLAVPVMWFGFAVARGRRLNALFDRLWGARPSPVPLAPLGPAAPAATQHPAGSRGAPAYGASPSREAARSHRAEAPHEAPARAGASSNVAVAPLRVGAGGEPARRAAQRDDAAHR
jgi:hypothetical protein